MNVRRQKLNNRKGFSLTELLVAVLILSMVSAVVAGGIPVARDAYEKVTLSANAQVTLSTAISALRNELCAASEVNIDSNAVEYYSPSIQNYSKICIDGSDIKLYLFSQNEEGAPPVSCLLVSEKARDNQLHVTYESVGFKKKSDGSDDKSIIVFTGLKVLDKDNVTRSELEGGDTSVLEIRLIAS